MNRLVESVTQEVLKALGQASGACAPAEDGRGRVLVLGDPSRLPKALFDHRTPVTLEDYQRHGSIARYEQVVIQNMTTLQLGQLALGLPGDDFCRAVMDALLNGIEVCLCEDCLWHRKCAGRGSTALYQLLEDHVRKLQVFGVKPLQHAAALTKPATFAPPVPEAQRVPPRHTLGNARPNYEKLITEKMAHELLEGAAGALRFEKGTLITPAAKDVFAAAGVTAIVDK